MPVKSAVSLNLPAEYFSKPSSTYDQSQKADAGKPRWDLLPLNAVSAATRILTFGAGKYSPEGWRTVNQWRPRYYAALLRHLFRWWTGERNDPESGESHLAHVIVNAIFLYELDTGSGVDGCCDSGVGGGHEARATFEIK